LSALVGVGRTPRAQGQVVTVDPTVVEEPGTVDEVVGPVVVVSGLVVVVDGGGLVVVVVAGRLLVVAGRLAVVAGGSGDRRGGRLVEAPAVRRRPRVVVGATEVGGARTVAGSPWLAGAVSTPSRLPPTAPSTTATTIVAHRRSTLNRTNAPRARLTGTMIGESGGHVGVLARVGQVAGFGAAGRSRGGLAACGPVRRQRRGFADRPAGAARQPAARRNIAKPVPFCLRGAPRPLRVRSSSARQERGMGTIQREGRLP
jgi:hypothetical protein